MNCDGLHGGRAVKGRAFHNEVCGRARQIVFGTKRRLTCWILSAERAPWGWRSTGVTSLSR